MDKSDHPVNIIPKTQRENEENLNDKHCLTYSLLTIQNWTFSPYCFSPTSNVKKNQVKTQENCPIDLFFL